MIRPGSREVLRVSAFRGAAAAASRTGRCIGVAFATSKLRYANTQRRKPSPLPRTTAVIFQFRRESRKVDRDARRCRKRVAPLSLRWGGAGYREVGGRLAPAGDLLPELYQQRPDLAAVALDHGGEFI